MNLILAYAWVVIALIALWIGLQRYLGGESGDKERRERWQAQQPSTRDASPQPMTSETRHGYRPTPMGGQPS